MVGLVASEGVTGNVVCGQTREGWGGGTAGVWPPPALARQPSSARAIPPPACDRASPLPRYRLPRNAGVPSRQPPQRGGQGRPAIVNGLMTQLGRHFRQLALRPPLPAADNPSLADLEQLFLDRGRIEMSEGGLFTETQGGRQGHRLTSAPGAALGLSLAQPPQNLLLSGPFLSLPAATEHLSTRIPHFCLTVFPF